MIRPIWLQQSEETGEAHSAFRLFYYSEERDIDQAWRRFYFTAHQRPHPSDPHFLAPPQWHAWKEQFKWDERVEATDKEQRQLDFEASEKSRGNAISWTHERQEDFRENMIIYKNLRRGLAKITESGEVRDTIHRVTTNIEGRREVTETTVRAIEQLKYLERNRPIFFPADNSKPQLPDDGGSLFIDLDTIAELAPQPPPPPRDRYRPTTYSRYNPETKQEESWQA